MCRKIRKWLLVKIANCESSVASFEQLIEGTNSTSPCTRPRVFLLAFLETNPCPTLYPTLCFWKQLRGRGILRFQAPPSFPSLFRTASDRKLGGAWERG